MPQMVWGARFGGRPFCFMAVMNETIVDSVEGLYRQGERRQQGWSHAWFHGKLADVRTPLLPEAERV
jgi:hypothetical protein